MERTVYSEKERVSEMKRYEEMHKYRVKDTISDYENREYNIHVDYNMEKDEGTDNKRKKDKDSRRPRPRVGRKKDKGKNITNNKDWGNRGRNDGEGQ